jgi:metallo-beta-lactamase family protein
VTGSSFLLTAGETRILIDCGMFQGTKRVKELNYGPFPFDPAQIEFVLLTHAHIDHSGLLPKLIAGGFDGPIYATEGTRDLLSFMLPDSGYIQEREVAALNRRNQQRGRPPVQPIYTRADGAEALTRFRTVEYEEWVDLGGGVRARFWNAGHILGSASIETELPQAQGDPLSILFSGDLGPEHKAFHPDPEAPSGFDWVLCEGTYGGVSRPAVTPEERRESFAAEVERALDKDGILLIPAFAVERTQELLLDLLMLRRSGRIRKAPIFLDSPLAIRATKTFAAHADALEDVKDGDLMNMPGLRFTETVEESKAIAKVGSGAIILAASGMCDAGRVRHHLKRLLWRANATVLLVGHQAAGTLGALLDQGRKSVRIMGEDVKVRARIRRIELYSGHADGDELVEWLRERLPIRRGLFLVHGEMERLEALRRDAVRLGCDPDAVFVPALDDEVDLTSAEPVYDRAAPHRLERDDLSELDWHNDLAQFSLDLREALEGAADERSRRILIRRLRRALETPEG